VLSLGGLTTQWSTILNHLLFSHCLFQESPTWLEQTLLQSVNQQSAVSH
jgi:hypothetical protein